MPIYCYENKGGDVIEKVYLVNQERPKGFMLNGYWYTRSFQAENVGTPSAVGWPIECLASGVHADQAGELREHFKKAGVPTEVSADGNPVYRNAKHQKKALKCRGMHNKASYS